MRNLKTAAWQEAKLSKDSDGNFSFSVANFFLFTLEKIHETCIFSSVNKKNLAAKKPKKPSESLENCTTSDAGIFNAHFSLLFKNQNEKWKKQEKNIFFWKTLLHVRHQVWHQFGGLWVRGVHWRPLGPHLTPGCPLTPLNLLKVPTEITRF